MTTESTRASELLGELYSERKDNQWKTVCSLLDALAKDGEIISHSDLISLAYDFHEDASTAYKKIYDRAKKLNNRQGTPGRREIKLLAQSAVRIGIMDNEDYKLSSHFLRVTFGKNVPESMKDLIEHAEARLEKGISSLTRKVTSFPIHDEVSLVNVNEALKALCQHLEEQLWRRDNSFSLCLLALSGEISPWEAIGKMLSHHELPYPFDYEENNAIACLAPFATNGFIALSETPGLASSLHTDDPINFPLLTYLSKSQQENFVRNEAFEKIEIKDVAKQVLIEIIFLRKVRK